MTRQCWLINARSGDGAGARLLEIIREHVDVVELDFSRLDAQLAALRLYERVVVVGGDGTFSSVVTSRELPDIPVAFFAVGTANDLARDVGTFWAFHGKSPVEILARVGELREGRLATWECLVDGEVVPFCNYVSLGFEGAIVSDFDAWRSKSQRRSRLLNRCMYIFFAIRHLGIRLQSIAIGADSERLIPCPPTRGVLFANVRSHMGCGFAAGCVDPSDNKLECVRVSSVADYARMVGSKVGLLPALRPFLRGETLKVSGVPRHTSIQVDGETRPAVQSGELLFRFRKFVRVLTGD